MPEELIDVPIESLPRIDEHSVSIAAPPDAVWRSLLEVVCGMTAGRAVPVARALGCAQIEHRGEPGRIGSTVPGFIVTRAVPPAVLALMGEHRFSRYALVFRIDETLAGPVKLSAETRAEFPGGQGRAYKALVIGTRGHVVATRSILHRVRRRAEKNGVA
ncbi:MAG: hypothetical protein ACJ75R_11415 [Solirubrobacterales bacterium]